MREKVLTHPKCKLKIKGRNSVSLSCRPDGPFRLAVKYFWKGISELDDPDVLMLHRCAGAAGRVLVEVHSSLDWLHCHLGVGVTLLEVQDNEYVLAGKKRFCYTPISWVLALGSMLLLHGSGTGDGGQAASNHQIRWSENSLLSLIAFVLVLPTLAKVVQG